MSEESIHAAATHSASPLAAAYGWIGGTLGFIGVAAGAFGAHGLRSTLAPAMMQVFETAARYQLVHAVALVLTALALERRASRALTAAGALFAAGIALFSGSLYALSLTGSPAWGMVTPLGGVCLLGGWACLASGFAGRRRAAT